MKTSRSTALFTLAALFAMSAVLAVHSERASAGGYFTKYAAIAYSPETGKYGYSNGWLSFTNAKRVALSHCKAKDAKIVTWVGNGWCALAIGDDRAAYGFGYGETAQEAKTIALREAGKRTTNCRVAACVFSGLDN